MSRGVRNQKEWDSRSGLWKKDTSTKQNRQVGGKMWNSVVNMLLVLLARERGQVWRRGSWSHLDLNESSNGCVAKQLLFGLILAEESRESHLSTHF